MGVWENRFERGWFLVFMFMYGLIMLPLPWYYSETYVAGPWGVPLFLFGWIVHGGVVIALTALFAVQCLKRPEYRGFQAEPEGADTHV
ncbi:hypothetical protein SAMN05216577_1226 [Pseudomonas citronellolis]|uniref:DUF3311 domain-containing protein n=1 Tax=Pseudomonas citronellolis TaxID=53408 RepID=A0AAQ1KH07_9PSED|nr:MULTISPECIES: hypothetical protein [Pseudomonas]MCL6693281.1 hypothetical protein [Pseudomonas sp. R3.Fl]MDN6876233.1 hypothetical protein [Pseudomonas citronellolis]TGC22081.1 hypothetical protein CW310_28185 [Pseudomonas citronellolis]UUC53147.1 hypothetical protein NOX82_14965 [Pseudomonas citronellolis]SFD29889.1 hypothetical protein SAMN05216577_1226 [Pseudomonas citronellolis]